LGAVIASAVGDALGAPYEFGSPRPDAPCAMEGGGAFRWAAGEWTDDTQLALAVARGLRPGVGDLGVIAQAMLDWLWSGPADVGAQTRGVLGSVRDPREVAAAAAAFQARRPEAVGNGALMRTGPVALACLGDRAATAELAAAVSRLTHPHADSVAACVLWSVAIGEAIVHGGAHTSPTEMLSVGLDLLEPTQRGRWAAFIAESSSITPADLHMSNGWVVAAFQAALAAVNLERHDPAPVAATLRSAARAGGDTDTVAAIAGSLAGALYGASQIPTPWTAALNGRRRYDEDLWRTADLTSEVDRILG
jgi:ADP-ribosylglycohydrolase